MYCGDLLTFFSRTSWLRWCRRHHKAKGRLVWRIKLILCVGLRLEEVCRPCGRCSFRISPTQRTKVKSVEQDMDVVERNTGTGIHIQKVSLETVRDRDMQRRNWSNHSLWQVGQTAQRRGRRETKRIVRETARKPMCNRAVHSCSQHRSHFCPNLCQSLLLFLLSASGMTKAVYYKLWASTAFWQQRKAYGWYQVWSRMMPWSYVTVPAARVVHFPVVERRPEEDLDAGHV